MEQIPSDSSISITELKHNPSAVKRMAANPWRCLCKTGTAHISDPGRNTASAGNAAARTAELLQNPVANRRISNGFSVPR